MALSQRAKDLWSRVWRTFLQGAVAAFVITYSATLFKLMQDFASLAPGDELPPIPDLNFWRNMLLAIFFGGAAAVVSLFQNWVNDYLGKGGTSFLLGKPKDTAIGDQVLGER